MKFERRQEAKYTAPTQANAALRRRSRYRRIVPARNPTGRHDSGRRRVTQYSLLRSFDFRFRLRLRRLEHGLYGLVSCGGVPVECQECTKP